MQTGILVGQLSMNPKPTTVEGSERGYPLFMDWPKIVMATMAVMRSAGLQEPVIEQLPGVTPAEMEFVKRLWTQSAELQPKTSDDAHG